MTFTVRSAPSVERIARPSAPPICCDVLNRPEASPASSALTLVVAISVIGTNVLPMPKLISSRPGSRSDAQVPSPDTPGAGNTREQEQPAGGDRHADDRVRAHADALDEELRGAGADDDPGGHRQERQA